MAFRMPEYRRKAICCFLGELDELEDEALNTQGQDSFIRDVIATNDIKEPTGRLMTVAHFKVYMRDAWRRKDGRPNGSSKNMFNALFERGSNACGDRLLRTIGFWTGEPEDDVPVSTAPVHGASNHEEPVIDPSTEEQMEPTDPQRAPVASNVGEAAMGEATQTEDGVATANRPAASGALLREESQIANSKSEARIKISRPVNQTFELLEDTERAREDHAEGGVPQQAPQLSREVLFARRQAKLSDDTTTEAINSIWYKMRGIHANLLAATHLACSSCTKLDLQATGLLLQIYQRIFGPEWRTEALRVFQSRQCKPDFFLPSCIGAAIWILVLDNDEPLPWKGAEHFIQSLGDIQTYFNLTLEEFGLSECDMQSVIIRAIHLRDRDEDFQERRIQRKAAELRDVTMHALQSQIDLLDAHVRNEGVKFTWEDQNERLQEVFFEALLLKSRLGTSPDEYRCEWVETGLEYVRSEMKDCIQEGGVRKAGFCVLPKILAKYEKTSHWRTQAGAWVFTLPLDP